MSKLSEFNSSAYGKNHSAQQNNVSQSDLQDKFNQYKDMSKEELNSQLFKEVARQKSAGSFDYNSLEKMVQSLQGSLSPSEYQNIVRLLESLK